MLEANIDPLIPIPPVTIKVPEEVEVEAVPADSVRLEPSNVKFEDPEAIFEEFL